MYYPRDHIFLLRVNRYKNARFGGYFRGARAVLDNFKFAPGIESGGKNKGFNF